jgi:hypothetical protein
MKKIILLVVVLGLFMGGCGLLNEPRGRWVKQDMTQSQWVADNFDCDYKATMMTEIKRGSYWDKIVWKETAYFQCLKSKGYWYERSK